MNGGLEMDDSKVFQPFVNATKGIIYSMAELELKEDGECYEETDDLISFGATVVVGYVGKMKGRMLLDFEPNTAIQLANIINGEEYASVDDEMVIATLSEIGNIVAGDAITNLNNEFSLGSRLAPPIVFSGDDVVIGTNNMQSLSIILSSEFGRIKVNIAYEGN